MLIASTNSLLNNHVTRRLMTQHVLEKVTKGGDASRLALHDAPHSNCAEDAQVCVPDHTACTLCLLLMLLITHAFTVVC